MTKITVTSKPLSQIKADALVVIHEEAGLLLSKAETELYRHADPFRKAVEKGVSRSNWFCTLDKNAGFATEHLLLESNLFDNKSPNDEPLKTTAARCIAACRSHSLKKIAFAVHHDVAPQKAASIVEGIILGDFNDQRFKGSPSKTVNLQITLSVEHDQKAAVEKEVKRAQIIAEAQNHARELINAPHHHLTPEAFAKEATKLARENELSIDVLDENDLKKQGYEFLWNVGRGSEYPPRLIVVRYKPKKKSMKDHVVLLGKGITFDTGGYSIKGRATMPQMNYDMSGAAAVFGAMEAIVNLQFPAEVTMIISSAHNAVDGAAYTPGCILTHKSGKTVWIENTDAEGRLVLADGLYKAGEEGADLIIDVATLTGAVKAALGLSTAGFFTDDEKLADAIYHAGEATGDGTWRLPLVKEYESMLNHHLADISNMGSNPAGGAIHAANFLKNFVPENTRWAHLDIAGVANTNGSRYYSKGATGFGVRLLLETLRHLLEERWPDKETRQIKGKNKRGKS